jgi:broad specificity phosphatase PhoE
MRAFLLRHAESRSNAATDVVALSEEEGDRLSERGERQAAAAAELIAGTLEVRRIVCSPMRRARQTAAPIERACRLEAEVWDWIHELREPDGYEQLGAEEQQRQRWSRRMAEHAGDPGHAPGGGESFADLVARVERTLARLADDDVDRTLLVGHGIFLRFAFAHTVLGDGFEPAMVDRLWRIGSLNCGLSTFDHVSGDESLNPADIEGWRCVSWMSPTVPPAEVTGTGGGGPGN